MKKFLLSIGCVALAAAVASADSLLPNPGFREWVDCIPWTSTGNTTALGKQPAQWTISNVIGISGVGKTQVGEQAYGPFGSEAVVVYNSPNSVMPTQVVPGYFTLGTTWSTSVMGKQNDGGTFGGFECTKRPDAICFHYKALGEISADAPATFVAYLWKGTFTQKEVPANIAMTDGQIVKVDMVDRDRNILGLETALGGEVTKTEGAELIASVVEKFTVANADDFIEAQIALNYVSDEIPEKINLIFAANDYFSAENIVKGDSLTVANLKVVFYSTLSSLSVNGTPLEDFNPQTFTYTVDTLPEVSQVEAEVAGKSATASIEENNNEIVITVTNPDGADNDGLSTHVYTIKAAAAAPAGEPKQYAGKLVVSLAGSEISTPGGDDATITITPTGENTCTFLLPNLSLGDLGTLGDIKLDEVTTEVSGTVTSYSASVENFPVMGGAIIADKVDLTGTTDSATGKADMTIAVTWQGMPIECVFTGSETSSAINVVESNNADAPVQIFNLRGIRIDNASNLPAGIYIRRQGSEATKMIVR